MNYYGDHLFGIIQSVRKRRNLMTLLRGAAVTIAITAILLILTGLTAYRYRYHNGALISLRVMAILGLIAAVYLLIVRPLRRKINDAQIARLIEERHPGLEDRLVSAVEFSGEDQRPAASAAIIDRLIDDADKRVDEVNLDEIVPRKRFWQLGAAAERGGGLELSPD
jgi:hypothetical protein